MADPKEARVPDIGGYDDVPVIEVLVAVGDTVAKDQGLVTLESDKATMEVPAPFTGVVRELKVKVGDTLSEGGVVALIEAEAEGDGAATPEAKPAAAPASPLLAKGAAGDVPSANDKQIPLDPPSAKGEDKPASTNSGASTSGAATRHEARVPDIGDYDDVPVIEVLVAVGDTVVKDQGLATLESDKATMEVPSSVAGTVVELKIKVGDAVSEGSVVAIIESADASAAASASASPPLEKGATGDLPSAAEKQIPLDPPSPKGEDKQTPASAGNAKAHTTPAGVSNPPVRFDAAALMPGKVPYASPAVRLFARELGVDLMQVTGSARGGRIGKDDVQAFVKAALAGGVPSASAPAATGGTGGLQLLPWPKVDFAKFGEIETRPLSRIQKISGANLARNWAMIPHVTQHDDADITDLEALRVALNKENAALGGSGAGIKLTMLAFLMKAVVAALKQYPDFNASLDAAGETLTLKKYFHIGFAADTPNGLVVPVIRDVDTKGINAIAQESSALAKKARDGKLGPADMQGGCFSISSLGGIGGTAFTPIVNAPEVAILGVSKSAIRPVWDGSQFQPRLLLPLSLSYDHRVIDGASAARFTATLATLLGDMRRVLL